MRIGVDANLLLRVAQVVSPQHQTARAAIIRLKDENHELCAVPQVFYEYWAVATRPVGENGLTIPIEDVAELIDNLLLDFTLLEDGPQIFPRWLELVKNHAARGKPSHDARIAAALISHGVTHLLTFNGSDFTRFQGITVVSPEDVVAGKLPE